MARKRDEPVRLTRIYTRTRRRGRDLARRRLARLEARPAYPRLSARSTSSTRSSGWAQVEAYDDPLERIQNELFDVGADFAVPFAEGDGRLRITQAQVDRLEADCDAVQRALPELKSFVLPGGTEAAARLHLARAVCRRAELGRALGGV